MLGVKPSCGEVGPVAPPDLEFDYLAAIQLIAGRLKDHASLQCLKDRRGEGSLTFGEVIRYEQNSRRVLIELIVERRRARAGPSLGRSTTAGVTHVRKGINNATRVAVEADAVGPRFHRGGRAGLVCERFPRDIKSGLAASGVAVPGGAGNAIRCFLPNSRSLRKKLLAHFKLADHQIPDPAFGGG